MESLAVTGSINLGLLRILRKISSYSLSECQLIHQQFPWPKKFSLKKRRFSSLNIVIPKTNLNKVCCTSISNFSPTLRIIFYDIFSQFFPPATYGCYCCWCLKELTQHPGISNRFPGKNFIHFLILNGVLLIPFA